MYRELLNWQMNVVRNKREEIKLSVLYGDLYYQTPGALTKAEYIANPRAARPKAGAFQSADSIKAAIFQKTVLGGVTNHYTFSDRFANSTTVYGAFTDLTNPTFRNYERRKEPQWGARTVFNSTHQWNESALQIVFGSEFQQGYFNTKDYVIKYGKPGAIMTNDYIRPTNFFIFVQGDLQLPKSWDITIGLSTNFTSIRINTGSK